MASSVSLPRQCSRSSSIESVEFLLTHLLITAECHTLGVSLLSQADTAHSFTRLQALNFRHRDERPMTNRHSRDVPTVTP